MVALEIRFLAGRYHATPWGRHVNEAAVAWPPEPWRLLRALVAVWHRKADHRRHPEPVLEALAAALSSTLPRYRLPPGSHAHLQHYMPVPKGRDETTTLVFDGFLRLDRDTPLAVWWPGVTLEREAEELFADLAARLGYLGRAESWIEARPIVELPSGGVDALPWREIADDERGEREVVDLLAPIPASEYPAWRQGAVAVARELAGRSRRLAETTLPERFLDALRLETSDVQAAGWSRFPGTRSVPYGRPREWDRPARTRRRSANIGEPAPTTVRLALSGRPLPRIEDAVRVGEALRLALLRQVGEGEAPPVLTGRDTDGDVAERHRHLFFLPEDEDDDGWVDHLLLHAEAGLAEVLPLIERLRELWLPRHRETRWNTYFELAGRAEDLAHASTLLGPAAVWRSRTPYLHSWHAKRGFGAAEQIARELAGRTWGGRGVELVTPPEPLPRVSVGGTRRSPLDFHRFRSTRHGLSQPDRQGSFWRLRLDRPVVGPLALGFACHFGLGLFVPEPDGGDPAPADSF